MEKSLFTPRPRALRRAAPSLIDVTLDPAQRDAVERPAGRALLVLGEAGHGKTTVALHRLARVMKEAPRELRAAVVAPTEGLARLLQPLLRKLGADVEAMTYDAWAAHQARRAFPRLPARESETILPSVARAKRDPRLRGAIARVAAARATTRTSRRDLLHLFGDRLLMEGIGLAPLEVAAVLEHTHVQFSKTTEEEWSHVTDRERLVPVDFKRIDEGTAHANAGGIDVEDYAVLFALDRARGGAHAPSLFDVIMLDEAQELAPLELELLGRSLAPGGTLVVAGDADQHTAETSAFTSWDDVMKELGRADHDAVRLDASYRCPPEVVALARRALEGATPLDAPPLDHDALAASIEDLREHDPRASVAVLARKPMTARRIAPRIGARLVWDGRFYPRGAHVSTVDEVKGLEFDYVVVPDLGDYEADGAEGRRALYVAVTRARFEVVLAR